MAQRTIIRDQKAYEKAGARKQRREKKAVEEVARRIPTLITSHHDYRLVAFSRPTMLGQLRQGGVSSLRDCSDLILSAGLRAQLNQWGYT